MEFLDTKIGILKRTDLSNVLEQAINLWTQSFKEDNREFAIMYLQKYTQFTHSFFYVNDLDELVLMGFSTKESIEINGESRSASLIEGIAVSEKYQRKGIMSNFMDRFVNFLKINYDFVLIQAYNWKIYEKYKFNPIAYYSIYSFIPNNIISENVKQIQDLPSFSYTKRSSEHNKIYGEIFTRSGLKVLALRNSWIAFNQPSEIIINEYENLEDLMEMLDCFKEKLTIRILSPDLIINKRFRLIESNVIETKIQSAKFDFKNLKLKYGYFY